MTKIKAGDVADKDVNLKMQGGYGPDFLVPGDPDDGQPGVQIVVAGDVVSEGAVMRLEAAEANLERMSAEKPAAKKAAAKKAPAKKAAASNPASGVGVPTATGK